MKKTNAIICTAMSLMLLASCGNKHQFTIDGSIGEFRYVYKDGLSFIKINDDKTWYGIIYETSVATGIEWEYTYEGILNKKNELIITKGETRRVIKGIGIVDGGNIFGELLGNEIHSGGWVFERKNEYDGKMVYLFNMNNASGNTSATCDEGGPVDSTTISNGKFSFRGTVEEPYEAMIGCPETPFVTFVIVEPGTIVIKNDSIGGTTLNDKLFAFNNSFNTDDLDEQMKELIPLYYSATNGTERAEIEKVIDSLEALCNARTLEANWKLYHENEDNMLAVKAMENILHAGDFTYSEFDSIVKTATPIVANDKQVQAKLKQLYNIDATSAGKHYTDIQGVEGKLSDLIDGKLALVDFYASWCGPCRAEIKDHLVPMWKKYQKKGLVIVGLNVWERGDAAARKAAHEKVMADLGITYPQLVDSTRTATDTYGVNGIPQIMLIGPDGTILARDLRGAAIEEAIVKALGK